MKNKKVVLAVLLIACICLVPGYRATVEKVSKMTADKPKLILAIDPGHGGLDGGAVAADGTSEKDINLAIALELASEAEPYGVKVMLTRKTDVGLYAQGVEDGKWSKLEDLKERKRIIDETNPDLTISIHLNSFRQDTSVSGAQMFYPKNQIEQVYAINKKIAEKMQEVLNRGGFRGKERIAMVKDDTYLFRNIHSPILLVECGFLSNPDDKDMLKDTKFQQKIAVYIMQTIANSYGLNIQKSYTKKIVDRKTNSS